MVNSSSLFAFTASMSKLARFFGDGRWTIASLIDRKSVGDDENLVDASAFLLGGLELMSRGLEEKASLLVLLFEDEAPLDILLSMFLIILLRL